MTIKPETKTHSLSSELVIELTERPLGHLPAMFADEIEIIKDGVSDVATPAAVRVLATDGLRDLSAWSDSLGKSVEGDRLLSSEHFRLAMALSSFSADLECHERSTGRMLKAFVALQGLENDFPEVGDRARRIVAEVLSAGYEVVKSNALNDHLRQNSTMRPLVKRGAVKRAAVDRARTIAAELWQADAAQEYRVTDMAVLVRDILERDGVADLPAVERVKEWIKSIAPAHARRGGKPRKTS